jgi:hypothetical protein
MCKRHITNHWIGLPIIHRPDRSEEMLHLGHEEIDYGQSLSLSLFPES